MELMKSFALFFWYLFGGIFPLVLIFWVGYFPEVLERYLDSKVAYFKARAGFLNTRKKILDKELYKGKVKK